jgi:serine/threonine protein kinase
MILMEFMENGDLLSYLRGNMTVRPLLSGYSVAGETSTNSAAVRRPIRPLTQMALEIADAMLLIHHKKFIHRDLAARNCLIAADGTIKVGDLGLTRFVQEKDYYKAKPGSELPIRWMAPESIHFMKFFSSSDVFSFGITLWEIVTCGQLPYPVKR